jgi:hypothetical protein
VSVDWRKARIAKNEASFRDINERLEQGLRQVRDLPDALQFVCECGDRECRALISLSVDEYRAVRRDSRRFAVVPGHAIPDAERVVQGNERYEVVEKIGGAVEIADGTDRRAPGPRGRRSDEAAP